MILGQIIAEGKVWHIPCKSGPLGGVSLTGIPVNGELYFNQPGLSHGFVHLKDPATGECVGFCGVDYFKNWARRV